jgi:DNA-binding transcriptional regulator YiaG
VSGNEFRKLRNVMELSQADLGTLMDVSERGIRRWENDEIKIPKIAELALLHIAHEKRRKGKS